MIRRLVPPFVFLALMGHSMSFPLCEWRFHEVILVPAVKKETQEEREKRKKAELGAGGKRVEPGSGGAEKGAELEEFKPEVRDGANESGDVSAGGSRRRPVELPAGGSARSLGGGHLLRSTVSDDTAQPGSYDSHIHESAAAREAADADLSGGGGLGGSGIPEGQGEAGTGTEQLPAPDHQVALAMPAGVGKELNMPRGDEIGMSRGDGKALNNTLGFSLRTQLDVINARERSAKVSLFLVDIPFGILRVLVFLVTLHSVEPIWPPLAMKNFTCIFLQLMQLSIVRQRKQELLRQLRAVSSESREEVRAWQQQSLVSAGEERYQRGSLAYALRVAYYLLKLRWSEKKKGESGGDHRDSVDTTGSGEGRDSGETVRSGEPGSGGRDSADGRGSGSQEKSDRSGPGSGGSGKSPGSRAAGSTVTAFGGPGLGPGSEERLGSVTGGADNDGADDKMVVGSDQGTRSRRAREACRPCPVPLYSHLTEEEKIESDRVLSRREKSGKLVLCGTDRIQVKLRRETGFAPLCALVASGLSVGAIVALQDAIFSFFREDQAAKILDSALDLLEHQPQ